MKASLFTTQEAPELRPGQTLKLMTWNVQFMAGNKNNNFFMEGGKDPWPDLNTLLKTLKTAAEIIQQENPDILLLQEIQQHSVITHYQQQLRELLALLPGVFKAYVMTPYLKNFFNPHPKIFGPIDSYLCVLSKYRITQAYRHALPSRLRVSWVEQWFQFKRAILEAVLPVQGAKPFHVLNTHLSAFSQGINTLELQVERAYQFLSKLEQEGKAACLGGDFNMLASPDFYEYIAPEDYWLYSRDCFPARPLIESFASCPSLIELKSPDRKKWYTNTPAPCAEKIPDKTVDYFFFTELVALGQHYVIQEGTLEISDHFPMVAIITLPSTSDSQ